MSAASAVAQIERETISKVRWRVYPFLVAAMFSMFLDRMNIGMASLGMNQALGLTASAFGFASGIFFISYFFVEVPSNLAMQKFGARVWMTRIMVTWSIMATLTAFVRDANQLYVVRFLLGAAEGGCMPGLMLFGTYWLPERERAKTAAMIFCGSYVAMLVGPLLGGALLGVNALNLVGWQWLFVAEGIAPMLVGLAFLAFVTNRPEDARWLKPEEKKWLLDTIASDHAAKGEQPDKLSVWAVLTRPATVVLFICYALYGAGSNGGMGFFMPLMIQNVGKGLDTFQVGVVNAVPLAFQILSAVLWTRHSDSTGERHWHVVLPTITAAIGIYWFGAADSLPLALAGMIVTATSLGALQSIFWTACTKLLGPKEAAAGFAAIAAGSALGGFFGPNIMGIAKDMSGGWLFGMVVMALFILAIGVIMHFYFVKVESTEKKIALA